MPQQDRVVGIDVSKRKVDACIRSLQRRLSKPSTPQGEAELIAWLRENEVGLAVMEASGGYERPWAEALRKAGIGVRIIDPKRVRYFAKSAGRLAKNDPIDAEMIAWFGETFATGAEPLPDPERDGLDRLVTARALLVRLSVQVGQLGEHRQPRILANAQAAIAKTIAAQLNKLEAVIEAKVAANAGFADRAAITASGCRAPISRRRSARRTHAPSATPGVRPSGRPRPWPAGFRMGGRPRRILAPRFTPGASGPPMPSSSSIG